MRRASVSAACVMRPADPPTNSPSSRVSRRAIANESLSVTVTHWSTISRFTCTSCQTRYGFSVAMTAAPTDTRGESQRRAIS